MEISQLRTFCEIVKAGSYAKASKKLFISQSAMSHQIKNLEDELHIKLFQRLGNKKILTDPGRIFLNAVSKFLEELDDLKRLCGDIRDSKTGNLSIATSTGVLIHILPDMIRAFGQEFPQIRLKFVSRGACSELVDLVKNDTTDLAIGPAYTQALPTEVCFIEWKVFDRVLITAKNHPLSTKKALRLADMSSYPLILPRRDTTTTQIVEKVFLEHGLPCEVIMEMDGVENTKKYVRMGLGIAVVASYTLTKEDREVFRRHDVSDFFGKARYGIYYRKDKYFTTAMKQFIRIFSTELYETLLSHRSGPTP
jgi:DNA-binding transcriptional LysR family regulator